MKNEGLCDVKRKHLRIRMKWLTLCAAFFILHSSFFIITACDKLEDSDVTGEALIGRWAFSYKVSQPIDYELAYQHIIFQADGSCVLTYDGGQLSGTYRASEAVIRIEGTLDNGRQQLMVWRVLSMSPYRVVAEYEHELSDERYVTFIVTLDKL